MSWTKINIDNIEKIDKDAYREIIRTLLTEIRSENKNKLIIYIYIYIYLFIYLFIYLYTLVDLTIWQYYLLG